VATSETLFWGLTWANLIAFAGIVANFAFTKRKDRQTRTYAAALDTFSNQIRTPLDTLISELAALMDKADDIVREPGKETDQRASIKALQKEFHAVRRRLARFLTDCDTSVSVDGNDWVHLEAGDMDAASNRLTRAMSATVIDIRENLLEFVKSVHSVRTRLQLKIEHCRKVLDQ
jgi:hypothetical protein